MQHAEAIKAKGVAAVACLSTADFFVMDAWGKSQDVGESVDMLSDGNHEFTRAGRYDGRSNSGAGLGERSLRYAMIVDDGEITHIAVEDNPGEAEKSSADAILAAL